MTREEAINTLKENYCAICPYGSNSLYMDSCDIRSCDNRDATKALEQEPCGKDINVRATDAISRQAALDTFGLSEKSRKYGGDHSGYDTIMLYEVQDALEALPSVQPQQKTGHWIINTKGIYAHLVCDKCLTNAPYDCRTNYCPKCGARMFEPQESEDKNAESGRGISLADFAEAYEELTQGRK